jgi:hypothetical protein
VISAGIMALALPFTWLARRERAASDPITDGDDARTAAAASSGPG